MSKTQTRPTARSLKSKLAQNNTARQGKPKRRKNRNGNPRSRTAMGVHLSDCSIDYARAKLDPFSSEVISPCIPDILDLPSQKLGTRLRGTITIGTGGYGYVACDPAQFAQNSAFLVATNSVFSGTSGALAATVGGDVDITANSRLPYSATDARSARVVAAGFRLRYNGTELNRGGSLYCYVDNAAYRDPVAGHTNIADNSLISIMTNVATKVHPVTRAWKSIGWNTALPYFYQYSSTPPSSITSNARNLKMIFIVTGTPGNTFEWEFVQFNEYVAASGRSVPNETVSHSDPVGLGFVKDFIASKMTTFEIGPQYMDMFSKMVRNGALAVASSFIAPAAARNPRIEWGL